MPRPAVTAVSIISVLLVAVFTLPAAQGSTGMVEPAGIVVSTNEAAYVIGETVQVTGQVQPPLDLNNLLRMTIFDPSGERFLIDEFEINNNGGFTWSFNLPTTEVGEWVVNARFSTKEAEAAITVLETDLFEKVFVENLTLLDLQGNAVTEVEVGESTVITAALTNDEQVPQSFMFIAQVINKKGLSARFS